MRTCRNGTGADTTATVLAALKANNQIWQADLYLIGETDDPRAFWLCNWESPLLWSLWGTFLPAVVKRGSIASDIGLDSKQLEFSWAPRNQTFTSSILTTSPYELARLGFYDNMRFRLWRCLMPTPGDANTWGAYELFGGVIGATRPTRGEIKFNVQSYLYVLDQKVPQGVIEVTNSLASYIGGTPPTGFSSIPEFIVADVSTTTVVNADCTSTPTHIFTNDVFDGGYLVFDGGSTLAGLFSVVARNTNYTSGGHQYNRFQIYSPLPWVPTIGDKFHVSAPTPIDQSESGYYGFPSVPCPETALAWIIGFGLSEILLHALLGFGRIIGA